MLAFSLGCLSAQGFHPKEGTTAFQKKVVLEGAFCLRIASPFPYLETNTQHDKHKRVDRKSIGPQVSKGDL